MTSKCPSPEDLQAALDGRGSESDRTHLGQCPSCRAEASAYQTLKARLKGVGSGVGAGPCLKTDVMAELAAGTSSPDAIAHLSLCGACREELLEVRAMLQEKGRTERLSAPLLSRLTAVAPRRRSWVPAAAAAGILVAAGIGFALLRSPEIDKQSVQIARPPLRPQPAPEPKAVEPPALKPPEPPKPETRPPAPPPQPVPPLRPEPPKPEVPAPPALAKPPAPPPTVAPKPAPEPPTVALTLRKASLVAVAGGLSTQGEGEKAWQAARIAQARDFLGLVRLKADVSSAKVRMGAHTLYLRRGAELTLTCEEGRTTARLERGEAFFDITPGQEPWAVETDLGRVSVLGTRFLVSAEKTATEVLLQRGSVDVAARGQSVRLEPGQMSMVGAEGGPIPPKGADLTRRLSWVQALEETLRIEAELMAIQPGFAIAADPGASGGRLIAAKDRIATGLEAIAETRVRTKQAAPYHLWVRLQWLHHVPSGAWLQAGDAPRWTGKDLNDAPAWQWIKAGVYEPTETPVPLKLGDAAGGIRFDQVILTTDSEFRPESK